jgi:hypothetical protein
LEVGARLAEFTGEFLNRVLGDPRKPGGGSDGTAINQTADDGTAFFVG